MNQGIFAALFTQDFLTQAASSLQSVVNICAALLVVLSLAGLSKQKTAQAGNTFGMVGIAIALAAALCSAVVFSEDALLTLFLIACAVVIGASIGVYKARRVQMTQMPELVALLHSFVGAAAVLVGFASYLSTTDLSGRAQIYHLAEVGLAIFIGAATLSGSLVAFGKLSGKISGKPKIIPGRNAINIVSVALCAALIVTACALDDFTFGTGTFAFVCALSLLLGAHLVLAIGGADMPVVVSMLNSLSGWAAAMAGFTLENDLLVIIGALVGSSGAYLSSVMCKAMNRKFTAVIFGDGPAGLAQPSLSDSASAPSGAAAHAGTVTTTSPTEVAQMLEAAQRVVIVPGYGMAVAKAQFSVANIARALKRSGKQVRFAVHPVAGRMPGHMNVLLAEANVSYDDVFEMDDINDDFANVDVVLVIGANDTVNPAAETDASSPIAGMPVMHVWEAANVIVLKRSVGNAGYAGVENQLFYMPCTKMLLGDAGQSCKEIERSLGI